MGVRLHNCKGITKGVGAPPLNSVECGKNQKTWKLLTGKKGRFCQKSSADACAGWSRKASPPTQLDSILCQGHPVAARTCSIAFVTLDEELSPVCKRWYTYCISSNNSAIVLSYQWLPTSIPWGEAMARRRKRMDG